MYAKQPKEEKHTSVCVVLVRASLSNGRHEYCDQNPISNESNLKRKKLQ